MRKIKAEDIIFRGDYSIVNGTKGDFYLAEYKNLQHVLETVFELISKINNQLGELSQKAKVKP